MIYKISHLPEPLCGLFFFLSFFFFFFKQGESPIDINYPSAEMLFSARCMCTCWAETDLVLTGLLSFSGVYCACVRRWRGWAFLDKCAISTHSWWKENSTVTKN